jgi:nucleoside-diphosphate-sugar epimerase
MVRSRRTATTVAVTGSGTALGARLVARLAERGRPVVPLSTGSGAVPTGVGVVVHLAASRDPARPTASRRSATVEGTGHVLEAAREAGVRRVVLVTSAEVWRARPGQVPVPERAPLRAVDDASLVTDWLEVERLADHARRTGLDVVVLRPAALVGLGPAEDGALLRQLASARLLAFRGVEPLWQLCHADDLVTALDLAATARLRGACAVACEGWLPQSRVEALSGRRRLELPASVALSTAERLHRAGVTTGSPSELDTLLTPVVVDPARLRAAGWAPSWTNEAALAAHLEGLSAPADRASAYAAGAAGATAALVGTAALVRRSRRRRRR